MTCQSDHAAIFPTLVLQSGMAVYRYSQEKTLQWLKKKVHMFNNELSMFHCM